MSGASIWIRCHWPDSRRCGEWLEVVAEVLDELGVRGFPKTSGGSGLHIYVRIEPRWSFAQVRRAALAFGREVERRLPKNVTTTWWRKNRDPDQVFLDFNQNARDHTIAAAWSVRGFRRRRFRPPSIGRSSTVSIHES